MSEWDDLHSKVTQLQELHTKLSRELPGLKEIHKGITEEVNAGNRQLVALQERSDSISREIQYKTENLANLGVLHRKEIEESETALQGKIDAFSEDTTEKLEFIEKKTRHLKTLEENHNDREEKLNQRNEELNQKAAMYDKRDSSISARETEVTEKERQLKEQQSIFEQKQTELTNREAKVLAKETEVEQLLKSADDKTSAAKFVLQSAQEKLADVEAKEKSFTLIERGLEDRAKALDGKEIALNDLTGIKQSHKLQ